MAFVVLRGREKGGRRIVNLFSSALSAPQPKYSSQKQFNGSGALGGKSSFFICYVWPNLRLGSLRGVLLSEGDPGFSWDWGFIEQ